MPSSRLHDFLIDHFPYVGLIDARLGVDQKIRLRSYGDDYMLSVVYWKREYEPETIPLFFQLAAKSRCTLDIGAHIGFYALTAARANPRGRVYAFEPMPKIHARLRENVALNGFSNVTCVESALGKTAGTAQFFHVDSSHIPSNSSLRKMDSACSADPVIEVRVPITTFEKFAGDNKIDRIDLMKVDTEGTEVDVFRGMEKLLKRDRPTIICEVLEQMGTAQELEAMLKPLGYKFYLLTPEKPVPMPAITPHKLWWNYLFTTMTADELAASCATLAP